MHSQNSQKQNDAIFLQSSPNKDINFESSLKSRPISNQTSEISDLCSLFIVHQILSPMQQQETQQIINTHHMSMQVKRQWLRMTLMKAESQRIIKKQSKQQDKKQSKQYSKQQSNKQDYNNKCVFEDQAKLLKNKMHKQVRLRIKLKNLEIDDNNIQLEKVTEVSLLKNKGKQKVNALVISLKQEKPIQICVSSQKTQNQFPLSFFIFSKLIQRVLKVTTKYFEIPWEKTYHIQKKVLLGSYIFGKIYKKSQHKSRWQQRYVVISPTKLQSYRNQLKMQKPSFVIQNKSVRSLYTKFNLLDQFLIIGIKHGSVIQKQTQFAISSAYLNQRNGKNWLFQFYRMLM